MLTRVKICIELNIMLATPWKTRVTGSVTLMHVTIRIVHSFYPIAWVCQRLLSCYKQIAWSVELIMCGYNCDFPV